ncbi:hypothetical protein GCM10023335_59010 [Streptomyces siamensis]|uniref:Uncharacterized protein n=1 Tax=Streptomyces siamensis TaxID=1274986 RepID=A0ABP9JB63_9ACTN
MDIVVRDGSGAGRALAAGAESAPAVTAPAASADAQARRLLLRLFALNPRRTDGS